MNFVMFHVNWKNYVRNRLLEHLRRLGKDRLFQHLSYKEETVTVAGLIGELDYTERSFFSSVEQYAFNLPVNRQVFPEKSLKRIPEDQGVNIFLEQLHDNYFKMINVIRRINEEDFMCPLEHPVLKTTLDVGWIVQYTTLYEQSVTTGIQTILAFNGIDIRVPWATAKYMRPVKKLEL